jgi:hypothetical protein
MYSMSNFWPGTGTPKSSGNAFTVRPASVFADDKTEQAKATLQRKKSHYGSDKGTKGHGHQVMPGLSLEAQKRLKAAPFSAPIAPSKSGYAKPTKRSAA